MNDTLPHEHGWITTSRHATSDGVVIYVRCLDCGAHRIELAGESRLVLTHAT